MNLHHLHLHYHDIIMSTMVSQITGISIVCSTVGSGADQRKHQSAVSLAFVCGIQWWPVSSPHKRPVTWKMFPFYDVIMHLSGIIFFNKTLFVNTWQFVLTFACVESKHYPAIEQHNRISRFVCDNVLIIELEPWYFIKVSGLVDGNAATQ